MPRNIESIDDEPLLDSTPNFGGGLNSYTARNQLAPNQYFIGQNTMLSRTGIVQTRRGTSTLGTPPSGIGGVVSMGYLDTSGGVRKLLVCFQGTGAGTYLHSFDGTTWSAALAGYTFTAGYHVEIVAGLDKLYLASSGKNLFSWDGTTFVDLGGGATDAPTSAQFLVWGTNRLIAAGQVSFPDTVYFSDILDPSSTHWSAANRIRVGAGDGEPITGLAMFSKTILAVFKRTRIFLVDINPAVSVSTFVIEEVPTSYGCIHHRTIAKIGDDLWFLSTDGLRSLSRTLQGDDASASAPVSLPVKPYVALISQTSLQPFYASTLCATSFQGRYLLAYFANAAGPDGSTLGYYTLAYNVELGVWEGRWSGHYTIAFCQTKFSNQLRLILGSTTGRVTYFRHETDAAEVTADFRDDTYSDAAEIATRLGTRGHNHGANFNGKRGFAVELEFAEDSSAPSAAVAIATDYLAAASLATIIPAGRVPLTLLHQSPYREAAVEITTTSGKLAVRSVAISAFLQTMPVGT